MSVKMKTTFLWLYFLIACSLYGKLAAEAENIKKSHLFRLSVAPENITSYLLPKTHPLHEKLPHLFSNFHMFLSDQHLKKAGFKVQFGNLGKGLMIGEHPLIPNYLIKKFPDRIKQVKQLENYLKRIQGAEVLRNGIKKHNFKHLVVPEKWLYKLPKKFPRHSYVLVVEKMDIYDGGDDPEGSNRQLYYNMDKEILTELCTLLHEVGGCDSHPRNMPFTHSGKIALVDTEAVGTERTKDRFLVRTIPALNQELQTYAIALWNKLENEKNEK